MSKSGKRLTHDTLVVLQINVTAETKRLCCHTKKSAFSRTLEKKYNHGKNVWKANPLRVQTRLLCPFFLFFNCGGLNPNWNAFILNHLCLIAPNPTLQIRYIYFFLWGPLIYVPNTIPIHFYMIIFHSLPFYPFKINIFLTVPLRLIGINDLCSDRLFCCASFKKQPMPKHYL